MATILKNSNLSHCRVTNITGASQVTTTKDVVVGNNATIGKNLKVSGKLQVQGKVETTNSVLVSTNATVDVLDTNFPQLTGLAYTGLAGYVNQESFLSAYNEVIIVAEAMTFQLPTPITALHSIVGVYATDAPPGDLSVTIADPVTGIMLAGTVTSLPISFTVNTSGIAKHVLDTPVPANTPFIVRFFHSGVGSKIRGHITISAETPLIYAP
jgi:hypothetical protein